MKWAFLRAAGRRVPEYEVHMPRWQLAAQPEGPEAAAPAVARILTPKPLSASKEEAAANPRARSAKLRVLQKLPAPAA